MCEDCYNDIKFQSTLPREERPCKSSRQLCYVYFNPRSHERSDYYFTCLFPLIWLFQSTLPREERRPEPTHAPADSEISIHAPTRGATVSLVVTSIESAISIHAPTRGATAILHKKFVYFYTIPTINI